MGRIPGHLTGDHPIELDSEETVDFLARKSCVNKRMGISDDPGAVHHNSVVSWDSYETYEFLKRTAIVAVLRAHVLPAASAKQGRAIASQSSGRRQRRIDRRGRWRYRRSRGGKRSSCQPLICAYVGSDRQSERA